MNTSPVVVIGAGPVGLAMAAQLRERGLSLLVLEASSSVAVSARDWGHVRLFSPWRYNIDKAAARLLENTGWKAPEAEEYPTGRDLYEHYLLPLSHALGAAVRLSHKVVSVSRQGVDKTRTVGREDLPFSVRVVRDNGDIEDITARAVIDASGTWSTPNPAGASGLPAVGEDKLPHRIRYGIPDVLGAERDRYAGKRVMVVGAGHSAANTILALVELARTAPDTRVHWVTRSETLTRVFGGGDADGLPARGQLGSTLRSRVDAGTVTLTKGFRIGAVAERAHEVVIAEAAGGHGRNIEAIDQIVVATGQRPDLQILRELRLSIDPALESVTALGPLIDPNVHSCGTVRPHGAVELAHPERNFFIVGSKSYGRAPTFLLATGYEQARSVAAMIAGDEAAARRVELDLPETGVCSSDRDENPASSASACCAPKAKSGGCC